jgi:hypothetical protein
MLGVYLYITIRRLSMSLNNIELMNELMNKARTIRNEQVLGNKQTKEEMLKKANEKITNYFRELVSILKIKTINVDVDGQFNLHIRPSEKENTGLTTGRTLSRESIPHNGIVILKTSGYGGSNYAIFNEHDKLNWHDRYLYPMEQKTVLLLVNNFDRMKELVEIEITKEIEKVIEENSKVVQKDAMQIEALENFLN